MWTQWGLLVLGFAEVLLLLTAVYLTISQFRRTRASSYIERFNSSDAVASRVAVDGWLRAHHTARERLEALESDPELHTHVRRFANLFQELGAAYQFRVAHRRTVRVLFDALVVMYWGKLRFWINDYRAQADPTLYSRFEYLYSEMISRKRRERTGAEYLLAYGSLMDPASVSAALGREVEAADSIPVTLVGWERSWSLGERVRLGQGSTPVIAAFLDVEPAAGGEVSAVMVRITPRELKRLVVREKNYEPRDVRADVRLTGDRPVGLGAAVWCFVGRPEHRIRPAVDDAVLLRSYLDRVARGSRLVDPAIEPRLQASAAASGFPIVDGGYEFLDVKQAALV